MTKYKLLKDTPTLKAGTMLELNGDRLFFRASPDCVAIPVIDKNGVSSFDEWFEPVEEEWEPWRAERGDNYWVVDKCGNVQRAIEYYCLTSESLYNIGNYFEDEEYAEVCSKFLSAQEVIRRDAKGFKPNWNDDDQEKWYGYCLCPEDLPVANMTYCRRTPVIYFESMKSLEESFKKHPEEWRTYLTYERS